MTRESSNTRSKLYTYIRLHANSSRELYIHQTICSVINMPKNYATICECDFRATKLI